MTPKSWRNFALEHLDRLLIFNTFILINWFWHWYWLFDVETWSINSEYWQRKAFSLLQRLLTCHNSSPQQLSWGNLLPLLRKPDQNIFLFLHPVWFFRVIIIIFKPVYLFWGEAGNVKKERKSKKFPRKRGEVLVVLMCRNVF